MDVYGDINLVGHKSKQADGCLGDLDNASLSKWRHETKVNFKLSHLLFVKHRYRI